MNRLKKQVTVRVPASSGNLGPGFDVLGAALGFYNELTVRVLGPRPGAPLIHIAGEGAGTLPRDKRHAIYRTIEFVFRRAGKKVPWLEIRCLNRIPLARGMGSSSAAYLSGLLAANALLGNRFSKDDILAMATELEGHPDNVAPALLGGIRASGVLGKRVVTTAIAAPAMKFVVAIPDFELATSKARAVLPKKISMGDAVFNISAVALMPSAFKSDPRLLRDLLNDRLHEPYRARLVRGFHGVKKAAIGAGAYGVTLSGAGPTMLAWSPAGAASRVGRAMDKAFRRAGVTPVIRQLKIDTRGAVVR